MDTYSRTKRKHARDETKAEKNVPERQKKKEPVDLLRTRTGGAYIPPAKLKMMQEQIADKGSEQYQRMNWERLKKRIHGQECSQCSFLIVLQLSGKEPERGRRKHISRNILRPSMCRIQHQQLILPHGPSILSVSYYFFMSADIPYCFQQCLRLMHSFPNSGICLLHLVFIGSIENS
ncbi:hypothetical protein AB6A40_010232 [Gnathostoma spinigerum]|uniref:Uncharacterized protein n=1 Tax=Gnathostoma spinigerum TaxID=75299 RepID=A0ABD6EUN4_9BILA